MKCIMATLGRARDSILIQAQEVIHSLWLAEIEAINSVHRCYDASSWNSLHHYVLWFHDSTFECIAESFAIELHSESLTKILVRSLRTPA